MSIATFKTQLRYTKRLERKLARPAPWDCPGPVELARRAGIELDDWQQEMALSRAPRLAANVSRQMGKSTCAAICAMHEAYSVAGSLTLIISPSLNQSSELAMKCKQIHARLNRPVRAVRESVLSIHLANGSRVLCIAGTESAPRGYSPNLVIVDEAARVEDATWFALTPMVSVSGGRIVTLSTPRFELGWWFDALRHHRDMWSYWEVPANSPGSRIDPTFLESERESMGQMWYEMEYECKWQAGAGCVFRDSDIQKIIGDVDIWEL